MPNYLTNLVTSTRWQLPRPKQGHCKACGALLGAYDTKMFNCKTRQIACLRHRLELEDINWRLYTDG